MLLERRVGTVPHRIRIHSCDCGLVELRDINKAWCQRILHNAKKTQHSMLKASTACRVFKPPAHASLHGGRSKLFRLNAHWLVVSFELRRLEALGNIEKSLLTGSIEKKI